MILSLKYVYCKKCSSESTEVVFAMDEDGGRGWFWFYCTCEPRNVQPFLRLGESVWVSEGDDRDFSTYINFSKTSILKVRQFYCRSKGFITC